jgi:hypothetical protein
MSWLAANAIVKIFTLNIAAGTYNETGGINFPATISDCTINGNGATVQNINNPAASTYSTLFDSYVTGAFILNKITLKSKGPAVKITTGRFSIPAGNTATLEGGFNAGVLLIQSGYLSTSGTLSIKNTNAAGVAIQLDNSNFDTIAGTLTLDAAKYVIESYGGSHRNHRAGCTITLPRSKVVHIKAFSEFGEKIPGATYQYDNATRARIGWHKDPETGVITQWGVTGAPLADKQKTTFPIAFPNACRNVQITLARGAPTAVSSAYVAMTGALTKTDFAVTFSSVDGARKSDPYSAIYWLAIGE